MIIDFERLTEKDYNDEIAMITYNGEIDRDIINILRETTTDDFYLTSIAKKLALPLKYVELIQTILEEGRFTDCGTSPRGSWITDKGRDYLNFLDKQELNLTENIN